MAVFGKNILENLTTAMYSDRRVMFREYIQNACDAVDAAIKQKIISREEARIDISIVNDTITIEDNGCGIPSADFMRVLSDIANSDKSRAEDKGFRGIGRLCGLAYCTKLEFISSALGEKCINIMTWDAKKMRGMLNDNKKRAADEVLNDILKVTSEQTSEDTHFFKVVMTGISKDSQGLLDSSDIRDYLSFEAPVPYDSAFMFYKQIVDHAQILGIAIDEYPIYLDNEQLFKKYSTRLYSSGKLHDKIEAVEFKDFYDENDRLVSWMWFGLSSFNGQIKPENKQRGIRLRKNNIQIGSSRTLGEQNLFPENRSNEYFIGEVFAVNADLVPNARRDYFNENTVRTTFESLLKEFFKDLWKLCNIASADRSDYRRIADYSSAVENYEEKKKIGFAGAVERETLDANLEEKKQKAEDAQKRLQRQVSTSTDDSSVSTLKQKVRTIVSAVERLESPDKPLPTLQTTDPSNNTKLKSKFITDDLSQYTKETRKVVSRIYDVINQIAPELAEELISNIQLALKSKKE